MGFLLQAAVARRWPVLDRHAVAMLTRESCARALLMAIHPLGWGTPPPRQRLVKAPARPALLLVPGFGFSRSSLAFVQTFLVQRGWRWVWAVNGASPRRLGQRIRQLKTACGGAPVDIVAFGEGGLTVVRALRSSDELTACIRRVVTLGTPWYGHRLAALRGASAAEEDLWPPPVPVWCIWSDSDPAIVPVSSTSPPTAPPHGQICLPGTGHVELLTSVPAFRALQAALEHHEAV